MNKKIIAPISVIVGMTALSIGTTVAIFTSRASSQINLTAGTVKVEMESTLDWALSRYADDTPYNAVEHTVSPYDAVFENGGTVTLADDEGSSEIELDRISPMDQVKLSLVAKNSSDINVKWRYVLELDGALLPGLKVEMADTPESGDPEYEVVDTSACSDEVTVTIYGLWSEVVEPEVTDLLSKDLLITFEDGAKMTPVRDDNIYQGKDGAIKLSIETVQGNADVDDSFVVTTKEELMSYVAAWNDGSEHRPLRLGANIDVSEEVWTPLGTWEYPYFGEIKGKNFTITGLGKGGLNPIYTESGEYVAGFVGIAGADEAGNDLTIKDLKLVDAEIDLPETGSNIGILMGYVPSTSDFNSKGDGVGAGNQQLNLLTVDGVSVDGVVSGKKTCGGLIGKSYTTGSLEISNCTIDVDVTTATNHIAEIVAYVNGAAALNIHDNDLAGSLRAPIDQYRMDDEVVIATFLESYIIDSNSSEVKLFYNNNEIEDPVKITNEFNDDGSIKTIDVVWDGTDLGKNVIVAAHGSEKLRITLKNSAANNNQAMMTNQATDNVVVTLDNFCTTGNISIANLILKGDCNIVNSYTTAKQTLLIEDGMYKNTTIDANGVATMNGGKVTSFTVNAGATLNLNGGEGVEVFLQAGSSLNTGNKLLEATEDNYTFKITVRNNVGTGKVTTINGQEYTTPGMTLYFLVSEE